jgi:hypothetical protein
MITTIGISGGSAGSILEAEEYAEYEKSGTYMAGIGTLSKSVVARTVMRITGNLVFQHHLVFSLLNS